MFDFFKNTVYLRIKPNWLSVLQVETWHEYGDVPALAIEQKNGKKVVVAVGRKATKMSGMPNIIVVDGFKHPRTIIADFSVAELTVKHYLKQVLSGSWFMVSPIMVIHPQVSLEGGLTQVEIRALVELGIGAGARKVYVWEGPELTKEELRELRFSRTSGKLLHP